MTVLLQDYRKGIQRLAIGLGIASLSIFYLLYSMFGSTFAELNIQLPFLDFPIFVGEVLLGVCLAILLINRREWWKELNLKYRWAIIIFICWLLVKAVHGYLTFGPLAFRNAALFYYILFALISYVFFKKFRLSQPMIVTLFGILAFMKWQFDFSPYHLYSNGVLLLILIPSRFQIQIYEW